MTELLERVTTEVHKLTPVEVEELRAWLADYQPAETTPPAGEEKRVDWSDLPGRMRKIFGDKPPLEENIVLTLRREERY